MKRTALQSLFELRKRYPVFCYVIVTVALMFGFYALLYHPYPIDSAPGRVLRWYLGALASVSSACLDLIGEHTHVSGTSVYGRFPFVVVIDCAALDAKALFAAAVIAFPAPLWKRLVGWIVGLPCILALNVARLIALYFAGASSIDLFHWLHEEVFVLLIIVLVCGMFALWAAWSRWPRLEQPSQK